MRITLSYAKLIWTAQPSRSLADLSVALVSYAFATTRACLRGALITTRHALLGIEAAEENA
jgi:hypothetical protein